MHLHVLQFNLSEVKVSRKQIFSKLRSLGVGVNIHYIPIVMQPFYRDLGFMVADYPNAELYYFAVLLSSVSRAYSNNKAMLQIPLNLLWNN